MKLKSNIKRFAKTTRCRRLAIIGLVVSALFFASCGSSTADKTEAEEEEALARTEFTERIENFFEYTPLKAGKPSQFLIHLTDLKDGTPVEKAEVSLKISRKGSSDFNEVKAKVGRVTGIYVAEVQIAEKGNYNIEFLIKNDKIDEKMPLENFEVE
jgi:hypothetical protein